MGHKRVLLLVFILFLMLPLGLMTDIPAWGEWDLSFYEKTLGFIPEGMYRNEILKAPFQDYSIKGLPPVLSYYLSALLGTGVIFLSFYLIKVFGKKHGR